MDKKDFITKGDAHYVQLVHTSFTMGFKDRSSADSDIIVGDGYLQPGCLGEFNILCSHLRAQQIHFLIVTRKMAFRASPYKKRGETRNLANGDPDFDYNKTDGCIVGTYNKHIGHGVFYIDVPKIK